MPIAILSAITSELQPFLAGLSPVQPHAGFRHQLVHFYTGTHGGHPLVAVKSGLGKVNAALATQALIDHYQPSAVIQVGLAGAIDPALDIGDIVLPQRLVQHDYDLTMIGLAPGEIPFDVSVNHEGLHMDPALRLVGANASPELLILAQAAARETLFQAPPVLGAARRPQVFTGTIVSGDQFIQCAQKVAWLRKTFNAIATEMEAASVAHVCHVNGVPFLGIRAISDRADGSAHMDLAAALPVAAQHYHQIVLRILTHWTK